MDSKQTFISFAASEREIARTIAERLRGAGLSVWFDEWEVGPGDSLVEKIDAAIEASDLLLVLLSPDAVESTWVTQEWTSSFARELDYRAINVLPAVVRDVEIPPLLASRQVFDLRGDLDAAIDQLVARIGTSARIKLNELAPHEFENLVSDLLQELGFDVEATRRELDHGIDMVAALRRADPFGSQVEERWAVQVKMHRQERIGVESLRRVLDYLERSSFDRLLIATTGQLTSVASEFVETRSKNSRARVRVLEGTELWRLLLQHSSVARTYFPSEGS